MPDAHIWKSIGHSYCILGVGNFALEPLVVIVVPHIGHIFNAFKYSV